MANENLEKQPARVFISYKRNAEPDEEIALQIYRELEKRYDVFIDQEMKVGEHWPDRIRDELRRSDFLIPFLSAESVQSEMVFGEVEAAHHLQKEQGHPAILPVRVAFQEPFEYPLSAYLNPINWVLWTGEEDTPALLAALLDAISGGSLPNDVQSQRLLSDSSAGVIPAPQAAAQPRLELPEGTMDPHSGFYVERPVDAVALAAIEREGGVTLTIKGPRQMGKSSLLMRTMSAAAEAGKHVVFLDFQLFDKAALGDAETFFRQFCAWLTDELDMEDRVEECWRRPLGNSQLCTRYVGRYLLKELGAPLVLAMDEVESVYACDFRSDFFSMLRSWHNDRAYKPRWKQLDLALVTSTEPYQLIENLNQSPFNVGEICELMDFSASQVADLNARHGSPLSVSDLEALMGLLGGHPYLTRRALYLAASDRITPGDLLQRATEDRGPFGDHLRYHLFRLHGQEDLIRCFKLALRGRSVSDEALFWRLRGAGLVRREDGSVVPRCKLYGDYFTKHFNG